MKYEYICPGCEKKSDIYRPMAEDDPGYACEDCGEKLQRDYGKPAAFIPSTGMYSYKG